MVGVAAQAFASVDDSNTLGNIEFKIVGMGVEVEPAYQAVPKGINTLVNTGYLSKGYELTDEVLAQMPKDYRVKAEMTGPSFQTPVQLEAMPGRPFEIQTLSMLGKYTISNIRLVDGSGKVLFAAEPGAVTIESIGDPIVTQVTTRELSVEELAERGVTFDESNFEAFEFATAIATESGQLPISIPVLVPKDEGVVVEDQNIPSIPNMNLAPPPIFNIAPDSTELVDVPRNVIVSPFMMQVDESYAEEKIELPPIPGILVIPGNIGFLHQYFSAVCLVTNGAPGESVLVVKNLKATIRFPNGEDRVAGTDADPGDDPIRMAKGTEEYFLRTMDVMNPGPDGEYGTADDISSMNPGESGQADFTIEGLKEGTHRLDFDITATLEGLSL